MNWDAAAAIGEIVGAIGVILSVLYLSMQIRRSDQTARAESLQSILRDYRAFSGAPFFTDPRICDLYAKGITDFNRLNATEKRQFFHVMGDLVLQLQNAMQLYERGLGEKVDYEAWLEFTVAVIRTPGGKEVWDQLQKTFTPTVRAALNGYIAQNPDTPSLIELQPVWKYDFESETTENTT